MAVLSPDLLKTEAAIIEMTNVFRAEQKLAPVVQNPVLTAAARAYAKFLAQSNLFSHTADGRQPSDRVKAAGYNYCQTAENLSLNLDSRGFEIRQLARDAVEGWKDSPGHRRNLMAPHVTEIGVGIAKSKTDEKYLSVQLFGRPASFQYSFTITNDAGVPVSYSYNGEPQTVDPRVVVTHTACNPGEISFDRAWTQPARNMDVRYPTRDGDRFRLIAKSGDVKVDVANKRN
jgi:Cysteine-rich secretory protein family